MGMNGTVVIVGVGGQTSIGHTLRATAAAVKGSVSAFSVCDYLRDARSGEPILMASLDTLPVESFAYERMKALGLAAAAEALGPWLDRRPFVKLLEARLPVVLALPPPRPGLSAERCTQLARELIGALPIDPARELCALCQTGHDAGFTALGLAVEMVRDGRSPACLVGGVESYKEIETLHWLESWWRLKRDYQPNGFIPGEGAAFLLICSRNFAADSGLAPLATVEALGSGHEPKPWYSGEATMGEGLTDALQQIFPESERADPRALVTYCDMNGESWRADEWGYAYLRTAGNYGSPLNIVHPADCWGDVGAASGPLLAGLACLELLNGEASEGSILVWTAAGMLPGRSACLLARASTEGSE